MAEFPALPLFTDAYLADTGHLTDAEHGRYFRLLMLLWRSPECRIPNDDEWIARRLSRSVEAVVLEVRPLLREFFRCDGNWITQKRLSKEWRYVKRATKQRSDAAKRRWGKDKKSTDVHAEDMRESESSHKARYAPTPTPTPTPEKKDSEAIASAADAAKPAPEVIPFDTKAAIFGEQLAWLRETTARSEKSLRSWLGQCCGKYGDAAVLAAILTVRSNPTPIDPISRMRSTLERQEGRVNGRHALTPAESLYAGAALALAERERARDCGEDHDPAEPLLDSSGRSRSPKAPNG